jgi:hypothetical protein
MRSAKLTEIAGRHSAEASHDRGTCPSSSRNRVTAPARGRPRAVFAILTIFLFLLSLRATIMAAISIPLSILTALVVMRSPGHHHHPDARRLAVAVGRVVDDAIVSSRTSIATSSRDRKTAAITKGGRRGDHRQNADTVALLRRWFRGRSRRSSSSLRLTVTSRCWHRWSAP